MSSLPSNQIDGNNWVRAGQVRELHHIEPDSANSENHDRFANLHFGVVIDHAGGGGHGASEQRRHLQIVAGWKHESNGSRKLLQIR